MVGVFPRPLSSPPASERGQASVEMLGVLPFVLIVGAVLWQLALAGHTAWQCANAARVAARAQVVGENAEAAARTALSDGLEHGLEVDDRRSEGGVRVSVRMPMLSHLWSAPVGVSATASLGASP